MASAMPLQEVHNLPTNHPVNFAKAVQKGPSGRMVPEAATNTEEALPVFDLGLWLAIQGHEMTKELPAEVHQLCKQLADCLERTGCLVVSDHPVGGCCITQIFVLAVAAASELVTVTRCAPSIASSVTLAV
jgi:hypothetical protein